MLCVLCLELAVAERQYCEKLESKENQSKLLFAVGWKVEELKRLVDSCQQLIATVSSIIGVLDDPLIDMDEANIAQRLHKVRENAYTSTRDVSRHQRVPASHIFVMMIASEQRNIKPYALPVQCVPYHSINQQLMRKLVNNLVKEMHSRGMKVCG